VFHAPAPGHAARPVVARVQGPGVERITLDRPGATVDQLLALLESEGRRAILVHTLQRSLVESLGTASLAPTLAGGRARVRPVQVEARARATAEVSVPAAAPEGLLFGLHTPPDPAVAPTEHAVAPFTPPRSHRNRTWSEGARRLAARGLGARRSDDHGTGDSKGASAFLGPTRPRRGDAVDVLRAPLADRIGEHSPARVASRARASSVYGDADAGYVPFRVALQTVFPRLRPDERARFEVEGWEGGVHGFRNLPSQRRALGRALDWLGRFHPHAGAAREAARPGGAGGR